MQTLRRKAARIVGLVALTGCNFSQDFRLPVQHDAGSSEDGAASCGSPTDANNCGVCGHSCLGGACEEGKCMPIMLASGQGDSVYGASWFPYSGEDARAGLGR